MASQTYFWGELSAIIWSLSISNIFWKRLKIIEPKLAYSSSFEFLELHLVYLLFERESSSCDILHSSLLRDCIVKKRIFLNCWLLLRFERKLIVKGKFSLEREVCLLGSSSSQVSNWTCGISREISRGCLETGHRLGLEPN